MYDIHTHLYWQSYDADRGEVLLRAREAGVEKMFVIGCTVEESQQAVALAEKHPNLFASIGIHPHEYNHRQLTIDNLRQEIQELKGVAQSSKKVVAIGECGLDYYVRPESANPPSRDSGRAGKRQEFVGRHSDEYSEEKKETQKKGFEAQLELAEMLNLPVIVHCRDAYEDMFEILKSYAPKLKATVLHCYMGDTWVTKKFLTLHNVYFSFTANITYPVKKALVGTKDDLTETVKLVPLEKIFTETDCPFLAPQEKRGERNEPAYVVSVAKKIAELHGVDKVVVEMKTAENAKQVFGV